MVRPRHPPQHPSQDHPTRDLGGREETWTTAKGLVRQHQRMDQDGQPHSPENGGESCMLATIGPTTPAVREMR